MVSKPQRRDDVVKLFKNVDVSPQKRGTCLSDVLVEDLKLHEMNHSIVSISDQ